MGKRTVSNMRYEKLREVYLRQLETLHFATSTIKYYECDLRKLDAFMAERRKRFYSAGLGKAFLAAYANSGGCTKKSLARTVRRLNELVECGTFALCKTEKKAPSPPKHYRKQLDDYADYLTRQNLRAGTIRTYTRCVCQVMRSLRSRGVLNLSDITPADIYAAFKATTLKSNFAIPVRNFLRYLYRTKRHSLDLSPIVPAVRRFRPVPSVYTEDETGRMLSGIDRATLIGKRDYAAILLALRLGVRGGDIINLKVSDVDFDSSIISFIQEKTLAAQKLELLPEIAEALTDYLAARKNPGGSPFVFLMMHAPYNPLRTNIAGAAVCKQIEKTGVDAGDRKRGSHAMRSTLASELASENVPYDVIRKILGHDNPETVKHYVRVDIDMLRKCALDAPVPTGRFADKLFMQGGGVS